MLPSETAIPPDTAASQCDELAAVRAKLRTAMTLLTRSQAYVPDALRYAIADWLGGREAATWRTE